MNFALRLPPGFLILGLLLIYVGERAIGGDSLLRDIITVSGLSLALIAAVLRVIDFRIARGSARGAATVAMAGYGVVVLGLVIYIVATGEVRGLEAEGTPAVALEVAWMVALIAGVPMALAADWARRGHRDPTRIESRRVASAASGALTLGLALSWVIAANVLANDHDVRWDWSEINRVEPGEGTRDLVDNLSADVRVVLFYPPGSDTLQRITPYFDGLAARSAKLTVQTVDYVVEPALAKELGANANGTIAIARGSETHRVRVSPNATEAKRQLRDFDRKVQEALLKVSYERRTVSFTVGHGERKAHRDPDSGREGTSKLRSWLRALNVTIKDLGMGQGLGSAISKDAGIVTVIGPTERFLPEEVASLADWYHGGGSLLILTDPDVDDGLDPLLEVLGLKRQAGVVCHDRTHLRIAGGVSDRVALVSNRFGTHPVAKTLSRFSQEAWVSFLGAGALKILPARGAQALVRPQGGSWLDTDGNREKGPAEDATAAWMLATASQTGTGADAGRAVVIADSDLLADARISRPNLQLFTDAVAWLARAGDAQLRVTEPQKDPPLVHTRDEDVVLFWGTVGGIPLAVLLIGLGLVRLRRRRPRRGGAA